MTTFTDLQLIEPLLKALSEEKYEHPTPIQVRAIPQLLDGRDVLGCAQTGTGKTAAFALPILQLMAEHSRKSGRRPIRALVLSPTRELAAQIGESFAAYGRHMHLRHLVVFGGVKQHSQVRSLARGVDILVATPGRMLDLQGQGHIDLGSVEFFVLDEADRMLDMGFVHDIRKVLKMLPRTRQNLLFSATMPQTIVELASAFLDRPVRVEVDPQASTVEAIAQRVMFTEKSNKKHLLANLIKALDMDRALVFTRTKHGANRLVKQLERVEITAAAIHGNKSQNARTRALNGFRQGTIRILVATDLASRGIDVEGISHVFNYDLPHPAENYVHRIGRTGRAGAQGVAISLCEPGDGGYLRAIEKLIGMDIPVVSKHHYHCEAAIPPPLQHRQSQAKPRAHSRSPRKRRAGHNRRGRPQSGR